LIGWLLDTNVIAALINPDGAPSVKAWAATQAEDKLYMSVLTLGEYDKGIHYLLLEHTERSRYLAARDALEARFKGRILSVDDKVVRRWGVISGTVRGESGTAPNVIDTLLAATAIESRTFLVTRNVKDVQQSGAAVFNPWEDDPAGFVIA
jgi:predicted nucleic acid-binding protein